MIAQNLTKFTLFTVLLGIGFAMAVFRPQVFPPAAVKPASEQVQDHAIDVGPKPDSGGREEQDLSYESLLSWQRDLESRAVELEQRQAVLKDWETSLEAWEKRLADRAGLLDSKEGEIDEQWAAVQAAQARLAQQWQDLHGERVRLGQGWKDLQAQRARIDEGLAHLREVGDRLQAKEASLGVREQKLEGRERLSTAALVVSGLLAVPSMVVLVALTWQDRRVVDKKDQPSKASQTRRTRWLTLPGWLTKEAEASPHRGNGRNKESVPRRA